MSSPMRTRQAIAKSDPAHQGPSQAPRVPATQPSSPPSSAIVVQRLLGNQGIQRLPDADSATSPLDRLTPTGTPVVQRTPLPVADIMRDITVGASAPRELFSWLHVMGERSGEVAHAASRPTGTGPDPAPVPTDPLPVMAHFFPSYRRHTDQRALILGGFHGDERPGYEVTDALVAELQQGTGPRDSALAFHTLIIPRVNPGAIADDLAGVTSYDRRCNRQRVNLNRNLPVPGASHSSPRCPNTPTAPLQPETEGVTNVIRIFRPHRILTTHAISSPTSAGIFADPNTDPTATQLACSMAGLLVDPRDRPANRITATRCNAVYPGDRPGAPPSGASLGAFAPTRSIPGQTVPVITLEAPTYGSLSPGTGRRSVEAFLRPLRGFITDPARLATRVDDDLVRDLEAFTLPARRLFLTGRLATANDVYRRIRERIAARVAELNRLTPGPVPRVQVVSQQRAFAQRLPRATPQAQIVFEKFTLTGSKAGGWDTLPDAYFNRPGRRGGVNRRRWRAESSATRLDVILRFSAIPGASRHHWGTDVDFNSIANAQWAPATGSRAAGPLHALGVWLQANAGRAGFLQAFTPGRSGGVHEEPWHYSYAPIAGPLRTLFNRDVRLEQDIVDPIMADWQRRATHAGVTLPADLRTALLSLNLSRYVNDIGPGL